MTKTKTILVISFISVLFIIIFYFFNKINRHKLYVSTNLNETVYTKGLKFSFYIQNNSYLDYFDPLVPVEFDSIYPIILSFDVPYYINTYETNSFSLQAKLDDEDFQNLIDKFDKTKITKNYKNQAINIIEYKKDKCIFVMYNNNIVTFSTTYSLLQNIIRDNCKSVENINNGIETDILDQWRSTDSELKVYYNNLIDCELTSSFLYLDMFVEANYTFRSSLTNNSDFLDFIKEASWIKEKCQISDFEMVSNKEIIFKINK